MSYLGRNSRIGDYAIDHELARSRATVIYRATHVALGRPVAIKVLAEVSQLRGADTQFVREAQILDRLGHPGIARIYDCGVLADGRPWFASELVVGPTLAEVIASGARIDIPYALREIAGIVEHAHRHGIAHRNLRAENIICMVDDASGAVRMVLDGWSAARELALMPSDGPADIHALGLIAFQLLSGVMAFSAGSLAMLANVSASQRFPNAPKAITALVDRMLARDLRSRPTASEVRTGAADIMAIARRPAATGTVPPPIPTAARGSRATMPSVVFSNPSSSPATKPSRPTPPAMQNVEADLEMTRIQFRP